MSLEKDIAHVEGQARVAYAAGAPVFAPCLKTSAWSGVDTGDVEIFTGAIAAVEGAGWHLEHWSVTILGSGGVAAFPIFRRPQIALVQDRT